MRDFSRRQSYWNTNITTIQLLLTVWATVSLVCSILIVDLLNQIQFFGLPLGFWIAQQGSILTFVGLTFLYASEMDTLDQRYRSRQGESEPKAVSKQEIGE
ncbi:DUF4212 domain-containing protein [Leptothoe spongobia]|uniref:DUF4212 domain-containing protein n=1 Tax=Leptothoe spongobia TAU-MAC 1115 TaxID=1967444 RepID=A0A947DCR7_9CYAN|nr:DUF4212 domain-containing protein [Leptothoe spongobia]MBT9314104.1 DUF4212 domain-containing protein [Leptothoe spongobia TAU-MAC 1115]